MTTARPVHLSVNVDHVATLRQARKAPYPDPVEAALIAENEGAAGITAHLRGDRRHIQDADLRRLRAAVRGKLNLEIAASQEMLDIALAVRPHQVTLVPERPDEVTTEGGLDLARSPRAVMHAARQLAAAGIAVSVFLDPDVDQIAAVAQLERHHVAGFEINTDAYTQAFLRADAGAVEHELGKIRQVAAMGAAMAFRVYAGHGLTTANVRPVAALPEVEELNIGHWLISRGALVGLAQSVREMLDAIAAARSSA